jgi:PKD repeat protein
MTSSWLRALALLPFLGLVACGGGGGSGSGTATDTRPSANFAFTCTDLACTFTNLSTDQDVGDAIVSQTWTFGDGTAAVTTTNATHTYAVGNAYDVTLTVADKLGVTNTIVRKATVTAPPVPAAPHANFTLACSSLDCTFTDTSTYDAGSAFQSRLWDFGDGVTLASASPASHRYAATTLTTYTVKLTVTDAAGKVSTSTQTIPVAPPASVANCVGGGCSLNLTQASKVSVTLVSASCSAHGNDVIVTAPITQTIVTDGCFAPLGVAVPLNGGATFAADTVLQVSVLSGLSGTTALVTAPTIRVTGTFATGWTLTFDDGFGGPGEPDFNDLVILVKATP